MSAEADSEKGGKTTGQKLIYDSGGDAPQTEFGYLLASVWGSLAPSLRLAGRLLVTVVVLALAAAVILNLRYKPLELSSSEAFAYMDTWTGKPHVCLARADTAQNIRFNFRCTSATR